jgi:hypothetical protein
MLAVCAVSKAQPQVRVNPLNSESPVAPSRSVVIQHYSLDNAGDHSLEAATVVEQSTVGYAKYIVHLHLASGAEQSVILSAPAGGLQLEMQDMTGDKVPNDIVLRPALVKWLPTVLINDGHEHFRVAMSSTDPSLFSSPDNLGSRSPDSQTFAWMLSSGFRAIHLANARRPFDAYHQESFLSPSSRAIAIGVAHATNAGRAPPARFV